MSGPHNKSLYVDRFSPIHALAPETKLVSLIGLVFSVSTLNSDHISAFAVAGVALLAGVWATKLRIGEIAVRALPAAPFLVAVALIPTLSTNLDAGAASAALGAKIAIGALSSAVFASTTRPADLAAALGRVGVPGVFVAVVSFMFRYLDLMVAEVGRIRVALLARGYSPSWVAQARPMASASGAMLTRSFERGERVHSAMLSRGFTGEMPPVLYEGDATAARASLANWILAAVPVLLVVGARTFL